MHDKMVRAKVAYNALKNSSWGSELDPAGVGDLLDEVAEEALGLATIWGRVVAELIDGHLLLPTEDLRRLCWRYSLHPASNVRPFSRLVEFHWRFSGDGPLTACLAAPILDGLISALEELIVHRGQAVELVDLFVQMGLAKRVARREQSSILKQISAHVAALEKEAAAIHVLAAEVRMLSAHTSQVSVRVLFLAANTIASTRLALDEEYRDIKMKIRLAQHRDSLELKADLAVRPHDLQQALLEEKPTIVHFSGHGAGKPGLVFHGDADGEEKLVTADSLEHLFSVLKDNLRLVVLNACYSEVQAKAIVEVIDFVVGMKASIGDKAARKFAAAFYLGLGFGRSVRTAFDLGVNAIKLEGLVRDEDLPVLLVRPGVSAETATLVGVAFSE